MSYFAASQQTSKGNLAPFFQKIYETVRALRVNGTKFTLSDAFIHNLLALEIEKVSKKDERTLFRDFLQTFDFSVTLRPQCHIYVVFWTVLVSAIF